MKLIQDLSLSSAAFAMQSTVYSFARRAVSEYGLVNDQNIIVKYVFPKAPDLLTSAIWGAVMGAAYKVLDLTMGNENDGQRNFSIYEGSCAVASLITHQFNRNFNPLDTLRAFQALYLLNTLPHVNRLI